MNVRAVLLSLLWLSAPALVGDGARAEDGNKTGPEIVSPPALPYGQFTAEDCVYLDRLIAAEVRNGNPENAGRLRRIRNLIRLQMEKTSPGSDEDVIRQRLQTILEENATRHKESRDHQEILALYYLFASEADAALKILLKLGPASADDLRYGGLLTYTYLCLRDFRKAAETADSLSPRLAARAPMRLMPPIFCKRIESFRLYTPRPEGPLRPGEDTLLYCEVSGATLREEKDGYACDLMFGLCLKDDGQREIWAEPNYGPWCHTYRGRMHEIHAGIHFRIPRTLAPGRYHLFLSCRDNFNAEREAMAAVAFDVAGSEAAPTPEAQTTAAAEVPAKARDASALRRTAEAERYRLERQLLDMQKRASQ